MQRNQSNNIVMKHIILWYIVLVYKASEVFINHSSNSSTYNRINIWTPINVYN